MISTGALFLLDVRTSSRFHRLIIQLTFLKEIFDKYISSLTCPGIDGKIDPTLMALLQLYRVSCL